MCHKLCHLIWGIWWFPRSKDFGAIKAGKSAIRPRLSCQYSENGPLSSVSGQDLFLIENYVTKTCPNLSTYSKKLENHNNIIIIEIDTMKKSCPMNSKILFLRLSKAKCHFFSGAVALSNFQCKQKQTKQLKHLWKSQVWQRF